VCRGAAGDVEGALTLAQQIPSLSSNRQTQLELFILRRTSQLPTGSISEHGCKLLAFELLFLWNALPSCSKQHMDRIVQGCTNILSDNFNSVIYYCYSTYLIGIIKVII
jgi:hypothetical protein